MGKTLTVTESGRLGGLARWKGVPKSVRSAQGRKAARIRWNKEKVRRA